MPISSQLATPPPVAWWKRAEIILGLLSAAAVLSAIFLHEDFVAWRANGTHGAPNLWAVGPFVGLLLSIAVLPLVPWAKTWWESNSNKLMLAIAFSTVAMSQYLLSQGCERALTTVENALLEEYVPFIVLLFSLYVISGGISLTGDLAARPGTNTVLLGVGAAIASFVGTTGASMLLIRPLLQTNSERKHVKHTVIFFIFLVSNIGGCLLPIGDPPLFLGYLKGVDFFWTLRLWPQWLLTCVILLAVYYCWDRVAYRKETPRDITLDDTQRTKLTLSGKLNLFWLMGVVLCVALVKPGENFLGLGFVPFPFMRELLMLGMAALSLRFTSKQIRTDNEFNYHAILEVAALFIGIFICMQAPIEILRANGNSLADALGSPVRFFWATGALSGFLDNAPTYVVFFETAATMTPVSATDTVTLAGGGMIPQNLLVGISLGAVFMGAMTYIGNGPNFMVKAIAERSGVPMPGFFGYMAYSGVVLVPLFIMVTWMFL
ncbi:MAG: sodium:proton antiporter [Phycisphaerales bacterium]|nr:sodium:proton antiporter [Phycisphaerales bacterium]